MTLIVDLPASNIKKILLDKNRKEVQPHTSYAQFDENFNLIKEDLHKND